MGPTSLKKWSFVLDRRSDVGLTGLAQDEDIEYAIYTRKTPIIGIIRFRERKTANQVTRALWKVTKFTANADCSVSRVRDRGMTSEIEYCRKDGPGTFVEIGEIKYKKNQPISLLIQKFKETANEGVHSIENLRRKHPYVFKKYPELAKEHLIKILGREGYYEKLKPNGQVFPPGTCKSTKEIFERHMEGYYETIKP